MSKLGYAMTNGAGVTVIPSPRPNEVRDLVMEPRRWAYVDPIYIDSPVFRRYQKQGVFEYIESEETPDDPDYTIPEELERALFPDQRQFVIQVVTQDLTDQMAEIIKLADHINDSGIARKDSKVTTVYLRERHRPMLLAIETIERRHKKRKPVLALIKKQLDRINRLPS